MILIFFIPEVSRFSISRDVLSSLSQSPRWLLTKDRTEEARAALGKVREGKQTEAEIDAAVDRLAKLFPA